MKKMKLQMLGLSVNDLLSREQMKKVIGGSGGGSGGGQDECSSNTDCPAGKMCSTLIGLPKKCISVSKGSTCLSDSDCGNGQKCVNKPVGTGKWCQ